MNFKKVEINDGNIDYRPDVLANNILSDYKQGFMVVSHDKPKKHSYEYFLYYGLLEPQTIINDSIKYRDNQSGEGRDISFFSYEKGNITRDISDSFHKYLDDAKSLKELF